MQKSFLFDFEICRKLAYIFSEHFGTDSVKQSKKEQNITIAINDEEIRSCIVNFALLFCSLFETMRKRTILALQESTGPTRNLNSFHCRLRC